MANLLGIPSLPGGLLQPIRSVNPLLPGGSVMDRIQPRFTLAERLLRGAGSLFGGADAEGLSAEQNQQARKQALMQAGLQMMLNSGPSAQPRNLAQILASGALAGQQAGGAVRAGQMQQAQVQQAMQALPPQQRAMIAALPPEQQAEALAKLATAEAPKPVAVGQGEVLVDPSTGQQVFANPEAPELPSDLRGLLALTGADINNLSDEQAGQLLAMWDQLGRGRATQVTVGTGQQEQKGLTEIDVDQYRQINENASAAEGRLADLSVMRGLLDQGLETGRTEELTMPLRRFAASAGVADAEKLGQQELFTALANRMALDLRQNMPGAMSDRDLDFLTAQVPRMGNTPEGNRVLVKAMQRVAEHQVALADEADRYYREHGSMAGWRAHRREWARRNRINLADLYDEANVPPPTGKGDVLDGYLR